jgi:hypothetical protein
MPDTDTPDFGRVREVYEAAQKVAIRIRGVSQVPFRPGLLSGADRRRLHHYLVEVRNWADWLLRDLTSECAPTAKAATGPQTKEECHGRQDKEGP